MSAAPAPSLISLTALGTIEDMKKSIKSHADVDQVAKNDISVTRTVQSDETNDPSEYLSCVQHLYGPDEIPRGLSQSILIPAGATPLYVAAQIIHDVAKAKLLLANGAKIPEHLSKDGKGIIDSAKKN